MRERDVGIICVIIYDDLALKAWTQSEPKIEFAVTRERERERKRELKMRDVCVNGCNKMQLKIPKSSSHRFQAIDAQRLMDLIPYLHILWSGPFQMLCMDVLLRRYSASYARFFSPSIITPLLLPVSLFLCVWFWEWCDVLDFHVAVTSINQWHWYFSTRC